jgi:manganese/iron transport system ATP-binding protein/manganese/zinc/iron transport system ATP- binding protein
VAFGPPAGVLSRATVERTYGAEVVELPGDGTLGIVPPHHHEHEIT